MSVNSYLVECASKLVLTSNEKDSIVTSINTLETRLDLYFGSDIQEKFKFGSFTRGTILPRKVDEESDVDYMVVFDNTYGYRPQTFLDRLKRFAEAKYSTSEIHQSSPTIVLELNNIKFELVPAYKNWSTYYIPDGNGGWMETHPNDFNDKLIKTNNLNDSRIKPLIRLIKHWNVNVNNRNLSSYKIEEQLAYNMTYAFAYCDNYADYVKSAFNELKKITADTNVINRINSALQRIDISLYYEKNGNIDKSLTEIRKVFPEVS